MHKVILTVQCLSGLELLKTSWVEPNKDSIEITEAEYVFGFLATQMADNGFIEFWKENPIIASIKTFSTSGSAEVTSRDFKFNKWGDNILLRKD